MVGALKQADVGVLSVEASRRVENHQQTSYRCKRPREENGERRKLVAARSLDKAIMAILAAVYSSIEIRT